MKLKIVCLNVWYGGLLWDSMVDFLRAENADILALQEVCNASDTALEPRQRCYSTLPKLLGYAHTDFALAYTDNRPEGRIPMGNAVLSRLPITASNNVFFNEPYRDDYTDTAPNWSICPRNLQHVEIQSSVGLLNIYNFQGVWDMDGDNFSPERRQMSETIIGAIQGKENVILAGDSNAKETNPAMRAIEAHLTSVFGDERTTSFNMRQKENPGYATAVVDHMFVSPAIKVLSKQCPDIDVSDHLPLIVELEIPGA